MITTTPRNRLPSPCSRACRKGRQAKAGGSDGDGCGGGDAPAGTDRDRVGHHPDSFDSSAGRAVDCSRRRLIAGIHRSLVQIRLEGRSPFCIVRARTECPECSGALRLSWPQGQESAKVPVPGIEPEPPGRKPEILTTRPYRTVERCVSTVTLILGELPAGEIGLGKVSGKRHPCPQGDSNSRPPVYKTGALTTEPWGRMER